MEYDTVPTHSKHRKKAAFQLHRFSLSTSLNHKQIYFIFNKDNYTHIINEKAKAERKRRNY